MKEIENTRSQIQLADLQEFDERIKPIQDEVLAGVSSFREVQQMYTREKQDKEPKRMPFAKNRPTGIDGSCAHKASMVECQLVHSFYTRSTSQSTLDGHLHQYSVDTDQRLDQHLVSSWSIVGRMSTDSYLYQH